MAAEGEKFACGFCGNVIEVEEVPEQVEGVEVIGIVRHECAALLGDRTDTR